MVNISERNKSHFLSRIVLLLSLLVAAVLLFSTSAPAFAGGTYDGTAFRDYNANGTQDGSEPGIAGVIVKMYDSSGVNQGSDTTAANGSYSITATGNGPYRIEFTLPASLSFLKAGASGGTTVQFVADLGATTNVGFNNPADYFSSTNPDLVTNFYVEGSNSGTDATLVSFPYNRSGTSPGPDSEAQAAQIGTTYGLAYQRSSDTMFAAAYQKRHAGYGSADSTGAIYKIVNPGDGLTTGVSLFVDLNTLYGSDVFGTNPHPKATADFTIDGSSYGVVGKIAFGDMDIAEDELSLWAVNLNDRQLYKIPLGSDPANPVAPTVTTNIKQYPLADSGSPLPDMPANCANSDIRPFAVKVKDGLVYVGLVCSGENTDSIANAHGLVYAFDPAAETFDQVLDFGLTYNRGTGLSYAGGTNTANWNAWDSTYSSSDFAYRDESNIGDEVGLPQPMLADIEFDEAENMILGLRDRFGDQFGHLQLDPNGDDDGTGDNGGLYRADGLGDILRATPDGANWSLSQAEATNGSEFFDDDNYTESSSTVHAETAMGGMVIRPGSTQVAITTMDPINDSAWAGGIDWHNTTTGARARSYEVYKDDSSGSGTTFAKAHGLGDLEALSDPAPLEVGNHLWCDSGSGVSASDNNGIQDPGETTLPADIDVTMTCGGQSATVQTDANGAYLFTDAIWAAQTTDSEIPRSTSCTISVSTIDANGTAINNACGLTSPTVQNAPQPANDNASDSSNDPITDVADSDAAAGGGGNSIEINFTTGAAGENNHGLDFGFGQAIPTDWGDLPDSFDTLSTSGGASHAISSALYLGNCVDTESDGQPDAQAGSAGGGSGNGDDGNTGAATGTCTNNDDEDGVTLVTPLIPGATACVEIDAVNSGSTATLYGWMDFNGDGDFDGDANEALTFTSGGTVANGGATNQQACFTVPAGATFTGGDTHMRFRLTTDTLSGGTPWGGAATDGEVEDYYSQLTCVGNYLWMDSGTTANTQDAGDSPVANDTAVNLVWGGPDGVIGTGGDDVTYNTTTGTGGIYSFCGVIPDANGVGGNDQYQVIVPFSPGTPVTANVGSVALDSNGTVDGEASKSNVFTVPIPNTVVDDAPNDSDPNSFPDNQTDLSIDFGFEASLDFGDLPDVTGGPAGGNPYPTLDEHDGARHVVFDDIYLGACVDVEVDGQPDAQAGLDGVGGDDGNGSNPPADGTCAVEGDDEDGVVFLTPMIPNKTANIQVHIVDVDNTACLSAFIDFNGDGTLDPVTYTAVDDSGPGGTLSDLALTSGTRKITISVPAQATGNMPSRFRLTDDCGQGGNSPSGIASTGEVEDYIMATISDFVWNDTNYDGIQNEGATSGINGVTVSLLDDSGNPVNDAAGNPIQIVTANDGSANPGWYNFPGLPPGSYQLKFDPTTTGTTYALSPPDQGSNGAQDSDANVFTGITPTVTVGGGDNDTSVDAGLYQPENPSVGNRAWYDADNNGIMEGGELGISGATVTLHRDVAGDGRDPSDPLIATVTTSTGGFYIFPNIVPNSNYFVCIDVTTTGLTGSSGPPNPEIGPHPPSGTEENQTNGDDGAPLSDTLVCSQVFNVVVGGMPVDDLLTPIGYANNSADMKIDFGFTGEPLAIGLSSFSTSDGVTSWPAIFIVLGLILVTGLVLTRRRYNVSS